MSAPKSIQKQRNPELTKEQLISAAREEFEEVGFENTNTNQIARRARFAPQTFYRHFKDKTEIFLAVYNEWVAEESRAFRGAKDALTAAGILIRHHKKSLYFRRYLRLLSLTDDVVRSARAHSRLLQIERLAKSFPLFEAKEFAEKASVLLTIERLADACAENELEDLGLNRKQAKAMLAQCLSEKLGVPA